MYVQEIIRLQTNMYYSVNSRAIFYMARTVQHDFNLNVKSEKENHFTDVLTFLYLIFLSILHILR